MITFAINLKEEFTYEVRYAWFGILRMITSKMSNESAGTPEKTAPKNAARKRDLKAPSQTLEVGSKLI